MRFWAEHPEDAAEVARTAGSFNEAFINHPAAQKAIDVVALMRFLRRQPKPKPQSNCQCREGSSDSCPVCDEAQDRLIFGAPDDKKEA